jgi:hypothetical protein
MERPLTGARRAELPAVDRRRICASVAPSCIAPNIQVLSIFIFCTTRISSDDSLKMFDGLQERAGVDSIVGDTGHPLGLVDGHLHLPLVCPICSTMQVRVEQRRRKRAGGRRPIARQPGLASCSVMP